MKNKLKSRHNIPNRDKKPKLKLIRGILELVSSYDKEYKEYWGHDTAMDKDFIENKALTKLNNFLKWLKNVNVEFVEKNLNLYLQEEDIKRKDV